MTKSTNTLNATSDIALLICTYNPEKRIFLRVLKALEALEIPEDTKLDCIIVDNNSAASVGEMACVKKFLSKCDWAKVITEYQQGLTFARIAGIKSTTAPIIIFIDDDNEPAADYIKVAKHYLNTHSCVAVWGPGKVTVEFLDPVSDWFAKNFRANFQERNCKYAEYGRVMAGWTHFYPFGTGQVVKREVLEKYYQAVEAGKLASTDRKGSNLSSAGDIQVVWEAVKMGFAAGTSPELKITHLIPGKRSNLHYVMRLNFGTASSYMPALVESFPSEKEKALEYIPSNIKILQDIFNKTMRYLPQLKYKVLLFELAGYIGNVVGVLRATRCDERRWIYKLANLLKLE